ncbi:DNA recombination protein RmuC [Helicobacter sp. L8]|uniref:DNA recombination protein RmuC n=1 Tax=Helicobacter sp. L8 TaxID=2316078 RepID=UPI000EAF07EE|nr:DNA recombination protein RmuC [Helicobacter sp. L8]
MGGGARGCGVGGLVWWGVRLKMALARQEIESAQTKTYLEQKLQDEAKKLQAFQEQSREIQEIKHNLVLEIKQASAQLFSDQSHQFQQAQQATLAPLQAELKTCQNLITTLKETQIHQQGYFKSQLDQLQQCNTHLAQQAQDLAKALKGDPKKRGDFGEMLLESLLEKHGFIKGKHFFAQQSFKTHTTLRPDIVLHLPENRSLIIDSKLNLNAYMDLQSAPNPKTLKALTEGVYKHIQELETKRYHNEIANSVDFTIMFIPLEGVYLQMLESEGVNLFEKARLAQVILASPGTLMAILMLVHQLWKHSQMDRDYTRLQKQLSTLGARLEDLWGQVGELGKSIKTTQDRYNKVSQTLKTGKDSVIERAQQLGVNHVF